MTTTERTQTMSEPTPEMIEAGAKYLNESGSGNLTEEEKAAPFFSDLTDETAPPLPEG